VGGIESLNWMIGFIDIAEFRPEPTRTPSVALPYAIVLFDPILKYNRLKTVILTILFKDKLAN